METLLDKRGCSQLCYVILSFIPQITKMVTTFRRGGRQPWLINAYGYAVHRWPIGVKAVFDSLGVRYFRRHFTINLLPYCEISAMFANKSPMHWHTRCWRKVNYDCSAMHPCSNTGWTTNVGVNTPLLFCGRYTRRLFGLDRAIPTNVSLIVTETKFKFI